MIPSLRDHLSADIAWLSAEEDDPDWRFGPWPALANFPNWIATFADYGNATLLSAMVAATEVVKIKGVMKITGVRPLCFHLGLENGLADGLWAQR